MSGLNLLAITASRSPEELEAAQSLLELNKEQIINLEAAALTILDLNRLPISEKAENDLKDFFEETDMNTIYENASPFIKYGILPPIEIVEDEMELVGGDKRKGEEAGLEPRPKRIRKETWKVAESLEEERNAAAMIQNRPKTAVRTFLDQTFETLDPFFQNLDICQNKQASVLMRALFPETAVETWTKAMEKNCRDIYEPGGIEAQCNNTILAVDRLNDVCYICGLKFYSGVDDPAISMHTLKVREGVEPTCEHILPIIQAIFFLDLFRQSEKGKIPKEKMDILKKEYAWAHRCCNYVKSDDSFLVTKISQKSHYPSWGFNSYQTGNTLSTIYNTRDLKKFQGCGILQQQILALGEKTWKENRIKYIRDEKMETIINHINANGNGGIVMMLGYSNCVDSTKINEKFLRILDKLRQGETSETSVATTDTIRTAERAPSPQGRGRTYRVRKNRKNHTKSRKNRKHK